MEPYLQKIDIITDNFRLSFHEMNEDELNWKPDADTWSIAENIDHLIVINQSYFPIIESVWNGTYRKPLLAHIGFIVTFFEKTILKAVQPDRNKKIKTFSIWEPSKSAFTAGIMKRFEAHQDEIKSLVEESADLVAKNIIINSPANKNIVYSLKTAFDIIVTHEERHLQQALEVYELIEKNKYSN